MTSNEILKAGLLDIIFDNRNKQYGAYELRKHYNQRMIIALGMSLSIFFLALFFLPSSSGSENPLKKLGEELNITEVVLPKEKIIIPEVTTPQSRQSRIDVATVDYRTNIKITDQIITTTIPDQSDLEHAFFSDKTEHGMPSTGSVPEPGNSIGNGSVQPVKEENNPGFSAVSKAPEFPGGMQAWMAFLGRHLRAPGDLEAGEKKTVMVRFMVDTLGNVSNFEILKSAGNQFDNEVIRVMKKMPKWKPAIQNGHRVSVSFMQPVTFMGLEE
jgi:protein TonB